jgi:hypothetical protein
VVLEEDEASKKRRIEELMEREERDLPGTMSTGIGHTYEGSEAPRGKGSPSSCMLAMSKAR